MNKVSYASANESTTKVKLLSTRGITTISLLSAVAVVLMLFDIPLWFAPAFYKIDLSELPVFIGAFTLGPLAGVVIELIKILLNLMINGSDTAFIGETANFIFGCSLVVPSAIIYHIKRTRKAAILGMAVGTIIFVIAGGILNAYVLLPTYAKVYGMPMEALIGMGTAVNPKITNLTSFVILSVAPFCLVKGGIVSILTALLYKRVSHVIKVFHVSKRTLQK